MALTELVRKFEDLYESHGWKLTYPNIYCVPSWVGIYTSCEAAISSCTSLPEYKSVYISDAYGITKEQNESTRYDNRDSDNDSNSDEDNGISGAHIVSVDGTSTENIAPTKAKKSPLLDK